MTEVSIAARRLPPADRVKTLAGATIVSGTANAVGDFFSPAYGWAFVALGAALSIAAVILLWRWDHGPEWLENFFGEDTSAHWLAGRNRRWAVTMMVISSFICLFTVWKSHVNAAQGGFLASKIPLVADIQDKIGIREGLANQGISWDSRIVLQAFKDDDVDTLESFIKGGWDITGNNCCSTQIAAAFRDKNWTKRKPLFEMLARNNVDFINDWVNDDEQALPVSPLESAIESGSSRSVEWILANGDHDSLPAYSRLTELYFLHGTCLEDAALEERLTLAVNAGLPVRVDDSVYTKLYSQWFAIRHSLPPMVEGDPSKAAKLNHCERHMRVLAPVDSERLQAAQAQAKARAKAPKRNSMLSERECLSSALMQEWYMDTPIPRDAPPKDSETVPVNCRGEYAYEMVQAGAVRAAIKRMDGYIAKLDAL